MPALFFCLPAVLLVFTSGGIASTAGVDLSIPPVAPADVPALFHPKVGDIYLRWAEMFTCGAIGCLPPVGQIYLCLTAWGCIPPVVSPTLGGSKFEYTSGGSCGRACNNRPRFGTSTCGATRLFKNRAKFPLRCRAIAPLRFLDEK